MRRVAERTVLCHDHQQTGCVAGNKVMADVMATDNVVLAGNVQPLDSAKTVKSIRHGGPLFT